MVVTGDVDSVRLTVWDDEDARPAAAGSSSGFGLLGMAERARLLGGTLEAGPGREEGWTVVAELPRRGDRMTVRVLIADDQDLVRTGLRMILGAQPDIEVVGVAADGREAVALARRLRPDVCLFDIRMPEMDGIEATRQLRGTRRRRPASRSWSSPRSTSTSTCTAPSRQAPGASCSRTPGPSCWSRRSARPRWRAHRPEHHGPAARRSPTGVRDRRRPSHRTAHPA